jgi:hypothetical protein
MTPCLVLCNPPRHSHGANRARQCGGGIAEFVVIVPTLLAMALAAVQYGLVFHAKSNLNYAVFEGARAGTLNHASSASIQAALTRAFIPYYGGGRDPHELSHSASRAHTDLSRALRIEILSPATESFDDYHSPAAARLLRTSARVIPSTLIEHRSCPIDRPRCNADPRSNRSGQTLADANLLKLRVTWGIPTAKHVPLAGRFFNWAVRALNPADPDRFRQELLAAGRIPLVSHVTLRMQSDAIENARMVSLPGPGNAGELTPPAPPSPPHATPADPTVPLPDCPAWDPLCTPTPVDGTDDPIDLPTHPPSGPEPPPDNSANPEC